MIKTKKIISLVLILAILFTSGVMIVQEVHAEGTSTGVHDIFVAKDDSKLERFKERVLNRLLYLDKAIDVSDLDIAPNEIQYSVNGMDLTGIYAAREIVRKNPFYSTAATTGFPEFTYKDNGCVATVKYTYHPAWTQDFVAKVIASYDEVMALIKPGDSDFAKILKIHDWIVKNVSYGMSTLYYDFGVGALANRKAVCAGYAQCYQFLLSQVGIDSVYIAANTKKEPHAWNLVKLDGHWFHVDCTWDRGLGVNPNVKHTYFMLSDAEFNADGVHSEDWKKPEKGYPTNNVCTIQNKFYASNTDIATDVQIAANPIVLNHKFDPSSTYSHSDTEHWRTCVAGVEVRKPHDGSPCTVCGYTAPSVTSYTVTLTNDGNGTASASATSAAAGTEITLTAVPNTGYHFKEWKVISGSMTITNNKFTMPAENVEVKAVFEKDAPTTCSLTTQVNGGNGTISASKTGLTAGSTETITFTPDAGYEIDTVTVNGTATSVSGNTLNVTMNENKTVVVTYKAVEYNITVTDGKATVDAGSEISKAAQGTIVTLTANAAPSGKVFDKWEVVSGGITLADVNSATTTFTMPASAVSVKATYKDAPHTHTYNQETVKPEALKTPADCTNDAVYFKSCSCGAISTTDTFAAMGTALGHAYGSDWKYDSTNHWHECSRCHDKKDEAAHDYGSDNVCDTCGYYKTVPHTHNLTLVAAKAATCTESGKEAYYKCEGCGKFYEDVLGTKEITDLASWGNIAKIAHTTKQTVTKASSIKLKATSLTYNGKVRTPKVIVKDRTGKTLVKNTDYTVSYAKGRKYVGKYAVKITFKGKYSGTKTLYFTIKPKATSISSLKAGSKKFTVKWKKQATQTTGYQVQYSASSKFSKAKTVTVGKNTTVSKKISKLSGKKKYYVRVRTYKTVKINGKSIRIYSGWSKAKTVTTKK